MVAISADSAADTKKVDSLLNGAYPLLLDPDLKVIRTFRMDHDMGSETVGNMGYVIIDKQGIVRAMRVDPIFGSDADLILSTVRGM